MDLTEIQEKLFNAIRIYISSHGFAPTIRELCEITGKRSPATIHYGLKILKRKGYIDYTYNRNRTIKITKEIEDGKDTELLQGQ